MLISRYQKRLSGPLLDRIDIHVEVPRVPFRKLSSIASTTNAAANHRRPTFGTIRARVEAAPARQAARFVTVKDSQGAGLTINADTPALAACAAAQVQVWARPRCAITVPWTRPAATPKALGAAMQRLRPGDEPERASVHRHLRWRGRSPLWRGVNASNRRISRRQSSAGRADKSNTCSDSAPECDNQPHDKRGVPVGVIQILTRGHCCI
jgi:hypothetical protein